MLTLKQIKEIREHLEKAQNPVFFFDNDPDGLCSFLLLQRYLGRGKGVPIKSFPGMNSSYFRKVSEFNADYIFILDKPVVDKSFFEEVEKINVPVVWIDHHEVDMKDIPDFVYYYNPLLTGYSDDNFSREQKTGEPVTTLCYQITQRKEDLWIAVVGSIADKFVPDFYSEFRKQYLDLSIKTDNAFDILYKTPTGRIVQLLSFGLKDRVTNVINMLKFLINAETPYEVLEECPKNYTMHKRFEDINRKYVKLIEKAKSIADSEKVLFFQYGGDMSVSSDLANELSYIFPKKIVVVIYVTGVKANVSVRGKKIREITLKAIEDLEDARGGGHEDAVGARIKIDDLEIFREKFEELVK